MSHECCQAYGTALTTVLTSHSLLTTSKLRWKHGSHESKASVLSEPYKLVMNSNEKWSWVWVMLKFDHFTSWHALYSTLVTLHELHKRLSQGCKVSGTLNDSSSLWTVMEHTQTQKRWRTSLWLLSSQSHVYLSSVWSHETSLHKMTCTSSVTVLNDLRACSTCSTSFLPGTSWMKYKLRLRPSSMWSSQARFCRTSKPYLKTVTMWWKSQLWRLAHYESLPTQYEQSHCSRPSNTSNSLTTLVFMIKLCHCLVTLTSSESSHFSCHHNASKYETKPWSLSASCCNTTLTCRISSSNTMWSHKSVTSSHPTCWLIHWKRHCTCSTWSEIGISAKATRPIRSSSTQLKSLFQRYIKFSNTKTLISKRKKGTACTAVSGQHRCQCSLYLLCHTTHHTLTSVRHKLIPCSCKWSNTYEILRPWSWMQVWSQSHECSVSNHHCWGTSTSRSCLILWLTYLLLVRSAQCLGDPHTWHSNYYKPSVSMDEMCTCSIKTSSTWSNGFARVATEKWRKKHCDFYETCLTNQVKP